MKVDPRTQNPANLLIVVDKWSLALKDLESLSSVFLNSDVAHNAAQIRTTAKREAFKNYLAVFSGFFP